MKIAKIVLPSTSPKGFGDGEPLKFLVWANAPQRLYEEVWAIDPDVAAKAFHALMGTSEPQTVEFETVDGTPRSVVLDFRTPESAKATLAEKDLPEDLARWIANQPSQALAERRKVVDRLLPNSFS